jgi:hypothetical protein
MVQGDVYRDRVSCFSFCMMRPDCEQGHLANDRHQNCEVKMIASMAKPVFTPVVCPDYPKMEFISI